MAQTVASAPVTGQGSSATAMISGEGIIVRDGPGSDHARLMMVDGGKRVPVLERRDGWAQVRFHSGKIGWIKDKFLSGLTAASSPAPTAVVSTPPVLPPVAIPPALPAHPTAVVAPKVISSTPAASHAPIAKTTPPTSAASGFLKDTKPDTDAGAKVGGPGDHTQDNPVAAIGDSWKMIVYLAPILLVTIGVLRLVRKHQERHGKLPAMLTALGANRRAAPKSGGKGLGLTRALLGSFNLNNARERGGSIRVVESVPIGGANIHLIEVRGRMLLVGATANGVSVLTEFHENASLETNDFRSMLQAAAADMDGLDLATDDLPSSAVVSALDNVMRDTGDSLSRRTQRLRTVQEAENDFS